MSSPKMTSIFGRPAGPAEVASRVCAWAVSTEAGEPSAEAAATVEPASKSLRRLSWGFRNSCFLLAMVSLFLTASEIRKWRRPLGDDETCRNEITERRREIE